MKLKIISMPGPEKGMKNNSAKINYIFNVDHTYRHHKRDLGKSV
jgi:hypothetical protein